jgi:hypothetical protein
MGWTFRRRIKLGPINLNFSRSGIGLSAGAGPFRSGVDAKGRHYTNVRGPFGLYNRQYHTPATQAAATQTLPTPESVAVKDSLVALLFSAGALIALLNGAVGPESQKWLILFTLLTGIPAILGLVGYFGRKDATTGWFKVVAGVVGIEKWLLVGLLLLLLVTLLTAGSSGRKRR